MLRIFLFLALLCPAFAADPPEKLTCEERTKVLEAALGNMQAQIRVLNKRLEAFAADAQATVLQQEIGRSAAAYQEVQREILAARGASEGCQIKITGEVDCPEKPEAGE